MKRVKLKLSIQELLAMRDLFRTFVEQVQPATERLRTNGRLGAEGVGRMVTSILCERMVVFTAKTLATSKQSYSISIPPEYAGASLLAYWAIYDRMEPDVLLEDIMGRIHKQLA